VKVNITDYFLAVYQARTSSTAPYHNVPLVLQVFCHFISLPSGSSGGWTQTLGLGMMWRVFYHCASTAGQEHVG